MQSTYLRTSDLERFRGLRSKFAMNGNVFVCALLSRECVLDSVGNKNRINFLHEMQYTIIFTDFFQFLNELENKSMLVIDEELFVLEL